MGGAHLDLTSLRGTLARPAIQPVASRGVLPGSETELRLCGIASRWTSGPLSNVGGSNRGAMIEWDDIVPLTSAIRVHRRCRGSASQLLGPQLTQGRSRAANFAVLHNSSSNNVLVFCHKHLNPACANMILSRHDEETGGIRSPCE